MRRSVPLPPRLCPPKYPQTCRSTIRRVLLYYPACTSRIQSAVDRIVITPSSRPLRCSDSHLELRENAAPVK
ncbi:hypothetical protein VZT92_015303 [Zoarces viviparus]|uniref:Uncharacterized protein n=1 Tax=Zoarces viviparus TaxID=48416 RepID=A0AAW1EVZ9_ZOAVI